LLLLLFATGLLTRRLQIFAVLASLVYVVNLLCFSGLGRFYGLRYLNLEPLVQWISELRAAPGFDLTLVLGFTNTVLFALMLRALAQERESLASAPRKET
jgi:hypothetical protein